ncbi:N-acetyltransferase [Humibacter sp. BT305]|uniref:N-acetyltransferase family protein n=1 Tax=Cnuibacter physcomitrellae TaxID=1619308 RepID=A0A1X9LMV5_9MICO|nr:GNAT family N-acetyltransferase [Cnuibacter physcomitrellae]ARJ05608.1 N-acetyltransferase family protein [Cnuibacter physcomitrellae]AXH35764.1 N-acetyltransferase [Humibacter sp. BT305]MCS5496697.1 GNAT family N-acetyltransferase [Cnuibacter physcomitrellae]GGI36072.1 N-acetyltransferase [Cnuibacter physcomitrellae]
MLEEEYQPRRRLPPALRKREEPERGFEYSLRDATAADLPYIREIYNHYVANTVVTLDEDAMTLREWRSKFAWTQKLNYPFLVAVSPIDTILGFAYVSPWRQKAAYRRTVEISIYLGPAATGKGLGSALLGELIVRAKAAGIKEMLSVIADQGAEASLRLHQRFGFKEVGRLGRVGFKFGHWLGTVLLQKSIK